MVPRIACVGRITVASYERWKDMFSSFNEFIAAYRTDLSEIEKRDNLNDLTPAQKKLLTALAGKAESQTQSALLWQRPQVRDNHPVLMT